MINQGNKAINNQIKKKKSITILANCILLNKCCIGIKIGYGSKRCFGKIIYLFFKFKLVIKPISCMNAKTNSQ